MKILTAQQMRDLDRLTVEQVGIPYATLMETAGARVVGAIIENYGSVEGKLCAVFCGKGNNGGDGAVVARLLWMRGAYVKCFLFGTLDEVKGEARANLDMVRGIARPSENLIAVIPRMYFEEFADSFPTDWAWAATRSSASRRFIPDLIIDSLFGTGLSRPAEGVYARAIGNINDVRRDLKGRAQVVSVDIPSGLPSDTGQPIGPHVQADLTVTFTAPKVGNVVPPASFANGKLIVASIGTPTWLLEEECPSALYLVEESQVAAWLRSSRRAGDAHKSSVGDVLLIAGSRGKTGAAALASEAVLRAGAGLVTVATAQSAQPLLVNQARPEVMTEGLGETEGGAISDSAIERALELAAKRTVLAVGPGLSSSDERTRRFVLEVVKRRPCPVVIDADGLNALAPWPNDLSGSEELPIIITPHPGEMARLVGRTNAEVVADRISTAREFADKHRVITVLKGSRTVIAGPVRLKDDERIFVDTHVNPTGNAGMATAGSGDVLTGLIAGLLAQRLQESDDEVWIAAPRDAVLAGVYLHGLAGDIAASKLGLRSLIASDITNHISEAILRVGGEAEKP
jgi:ADP-dependent NAD(P)H-hydrate dehydratase / NAD(P)H-hydrate epimerase